MAFNSPTTNNKAIFNPGYQGAEPGNTTQLSGTSSTASYCGPWMIETQRMDISYKRIPKVTFSWDVSCSLSGANYAVNTYATRVHGRFNATYSKKKSYECFDSSAYVQPQTFDIIAASADENGIIYGPDSDFTASCMGVAGSINTLTEWYWRRKWDDVLDGSSESRMEDAFNCYAYTPSSCQTQDIEPLYWGRMVNSPPPGVAGSPFNVGTEPNVVDGSPAYYIYGAYSYNKESMSQIISFINLAGDRIRAEALFALAPPSQPGNPPGYCFVEATEGIPEYDPGRHLFV